MLTLGVIVALGTALVLTANPGVVGADSINPALTSTTGTATTGTATAGNPIAGNPIAGIVILCVLVAVVVGLGVFLLRRIRRHRRRENARDRSTDNKS